MKRRVAKLLLIVAIVVVVIARYAIGNAEFSRTGNVTEVLAGARWVEIGPFASPRHASLWIELFGLAYNALIAGAVYYMPYFTISVGFRLITSI